MTGKTNPEELIKRVESCVGKSHEFSPEDIIEMRAMLNAWKSWAAMGRGFKWIVSGLGLISGALAAIAVIAASVKGFRL